MENLEKYNNAFVQVFSAKVEELNDNYGKDTVEEWDSVHQLSLIAELEEVGYGLVRQKKAIGSF